MVTSADANPVVGVETPDVLRVVGVCWPVLHPHHPLPPVNEPAVHRSGTPRTLISDPGGYVAGLYAPDAGRSRVYEASIIHRDIIEHKFESR